MKHDPLRLARLTALTCAAFIGTAALAVPVPGQGDWEATLQARDIDSDGIVDAYYDTTLYITWLADANAGAGSAYDDGLNPTDGEMTWASANAWTAALNVHGVTGWRLPVMNPSSSTESELSHMYCVTLGDFGPCNPLTTTGPGTWGFTNTGPFSNLISSWYWTGTLADAGPPATAWVWAGDPISAYHTAESVNGDYLAWAVHDGDVPVTPAIPEPSTTVLMLMGVAALVFRRVRFSAPCTVR